MRMLILVIFLGMIFLATLFLCFCPYMDKYRRTALSPSPKTKTLFVRPLWGLGNRLRTISGAFSAAYRLGCRCVIIWDIDPHCPQHVNELFSNIPTVSKAPTGVREFKLDRQCEFEHSLTTLERNLPCIVTACKFWTDEADRYRHEFYAWAKLVPSIQASLRRYSAGFITAHSPTIGIHLRQGDIADAKDKHSQFESVDALPCCLKEDTPGCPPETVTVRSVTDKIRRRPQNRYWIATDRVQCIEELKTMLNPCDAIRYIGCFGDETIDLYNRDIRVALVDMYMLASCKLFYGSDDISSFSTEVHVIKRGLVL